MSKRKIDEISSEKLDAFDESVKKHTLDSDEEDSGDDENVLDDEQIEGEENGEFKVDGSTKVNIIIKNITTFKHHT